MLERGDVPILFSLSQMKNLSMTVELDPHGDKITCTPFGLYSSPAEHSTMGHIVLDKTNLAHQPTTKSCEQPGHLKRYVTFAMSERRPAYPAHAPDMDEDEDEDEGEDGKPHVRPASRKELAEEKRDPDTDDADLLPLSAKKKRTTGMAGPSCYNGTRGTKRLARASRGYLNLGQKSQRASAPSSCDDVCCLWPPNTI